MAEVTLSGVTRRFGRVTAVEDLSLQVADGEFVVLLGPTAAGKTTTLRLIAGLEAPDEGRITIGGRDVTRLAPAERDVAMVFQQFSLYPHFTVFDNLAFPLRSPLRRMPEPDIARRVGQVATTLRIDAKLRNKATHLSGGEMQRVAIGRALVREPAVFLMDEPLSSLDAKLREDLRIELKRIQVELGATVVYVTHDQVEAMTLGDRIGVLEAGRLVQVASPRELYEAPASIAVARRLGSPAINLLAPALVGAPGPAGAVSVGVRPEDVRIGDRGLPARVSAVEALGAESVVVLDTGDTVLHALVAGEAGVVAGAAVRVELPSDRLIWFDDAGSRLAPTGALAA